ncbi:LysR substrate-binding domain-containing protein, partial [Pseudomonas sp. ABFPK]|uniref:LysR substrate-binding domain-containing protein n=1 Tax=Pseudomonas sp. ABFPK TaxID=1636605 RepID=UPI000B31A5AB
CPPCVAALRLPGRMAVEQVARWPWNAWPDESGLGGRMAWNPQPLIEAFHLRYPKITVNLKEISQERIEELLLAGELDVGIAFDEIHSSDIEAIPLLNETLALVMNRRHRLAEERSITSHGLSAESLVLLSTEFATREQIDRYCRKYEINPKVQMEANALGAVIEIVRRTNLSTLLPARIALAHDDLVAITLEPERLERRAVLMRRKDAFLSAAVRVFLELAKEVSSDLDQ